MSGFPRWIRSSPDHQPKPKRTPSLPAQTQSQQEPTKVGPGAGDGNPKRVLPDRAAVPSLSVHSRRAIRRAFRSPSLAVLGRPVPL